MSVDVTPATSHQPRRKKFVDISVQGWLISGLLLLELLIFAVAMWFVYHELQTTIDADLYRVHQPATSSGPVLFNALIHIAPWIILLNVLVLIGIDHLWGEYLTKILGPLRLIIERLSRLDLRGHDVDNIEHVVLDHAHEWLHQEQERCKAIRNLIRSASLAQNEPNDLQALSGILKTIKQQLP